MGDLDMGKDLERKSQYIETYTIKKGMAQARETVEVNVTAGRLQGKSTRIITTRPEAAYFNSQPLTKIRA